MNEEPTKDVDSENTLLFMYVHVVVIHKECEEC